MRKLPLHQTWPRPVSYSPWRELQWKNQASRWTARLLRTLVLAFLASAPLLSLFAGSLSTGLPIGTSVRTSLWRRRRCLKIIFSTPSTSWPLGFHLVLLQAPGVKNMAAAFCSEITCQRENTPCLWSCTWPWPGAYLWWKMEQYGLSHSLLFSLLLALLQ